jgi:hypothetical protein
VTCLIRTVLAFDWWKVWKGRGAGVMISGPGIEVQLLRYSLTEQRCRPLTVCSVNVLCLHCLMSGSEILREVLHGLLWLFALQLFIYISPLLVIYILISVLCRHIPANKPSIVYITGMLRDP